MSKKAKYKVKNSSGSYDIIHFETSAEQIVESNSKQFITKAEKQQIALKASRDYVDEEVRSLKAENAQLRNLIENLSNQLEKVQTDLGKAKNKIAWTVVKSQ